MRRLSAQRFLFGGGKVAFYKVMPARVQEYCTLAHSPYTPWQRMLSTSSASSPKTAKIRSILLIFTYPALTHRKSFPGRCASPASMDSVHLFVVKTGRFTYNRR